MKTIKRFEHHFRSIPLILVVAVIISGIFLLITPYSNGYSSKEISNFEECVSAGFAVGESYPRQCWTDDGKHFVEDIGGDLNRNYHSRDVEECSRTQILCVEGMKFFSDETGCGCELIKEKEEEKVFCSNESRNVDACITLYDPVCGWNNPDKIKCIKFPCASTYSNSCNACKNSDVYYWTSGICPE